MRPGEGQSDDRDRQEDRCDQVAERQPPTGEKEPDDIAEGAERPGAEIVIAGIFGARHRLLPKRQQSVEGDVERRPRPRQADDRNRHDDRGEQPSGGHPYAAGDDPQNVEQEPEKRHSGPAHSGRSSSSIAAFRKRAASPPVTARWSKVSDSGRRRWATSLPSATTARGAMRPAPRIATCGGTMTSSANRPPNMPKFDKVMVWPRSSASGTERARTSRFIASIPRRRSAASRPPTLRNTGTKSPSPVSTARPRSICLISRRSILRPSYQALSAGTAVQPATTARTSRIVVSVPGGQTSRSASSDTVAGTISACERAMLTAIARRTPESGSAGPASVNARAARSTSALVTAPPGPLAATIFRSTPSRCANARTAGVALTAAAPAGAASAARTGCAVAAASSPTTVPVSARGPSSNSTRAAPTLTRSPDCAQSRATRPDCGDGTSTTAFSVSTETSGW